MSENASDTPRAVIVGAGPSGFYAADQLLNLGFEVDLLDALPTPFGLVRAGVAPDHPKIKAVTRVYEKTAKKDGFRFFGGVVLGRDVTRAELLERYHAVVYALGTSDDNRLGIPGEDRPGVHGATQFVSWYNGHPDASDHAYDLTVERAVVIGNGNVAIDVARMLVLHPDELAPTDTADHAIDALRDSNIKEVVLLGRRGPAQAAFTNPELRELIDLQRAGVVVDATDLELDEHSAAWLETEADITSKKNVEILNDVRRVRPQGVVAQDRPALPALARRDPRRGRGRPGHRRARRPQRDRQERRRLAARGRHRRRGGHRGGPRPALDRLPRQARRRRPVRRAPRPDPQHRRARLAPRPATRTTASTSSAGSSAGRRA